MEGDLKRGTAEFWRRNFYIYNITNTNSEILYINKVKQYGIVL